MSRKTVTGLVIGIIILILVGVSLYLSQFNVLPQSSYQLFSPVAAPTDNDRIMVVSPHQDDETLGAGGYLIQAVKAGATVEVVYATDGNKHGLKAARQQEALNATTKLGVKSQNVKFLGFPDGNLSNQTGFVTRLKQEIDIFKPTIVLTTIDQDIHPDHAACGRALRQIAKEEPNNFIAYYFLIHYHRYPRPIGDSSRNSYLLPPPNLVASDYDWHVFSLDEATQDQKYLAILKYKTQLSNKNPILKQLLLSFDQKNELFGTLR